MSGTGTVGGPTNLPSLARLDIGRTYDTHELLIEESTTAGMGGDPIPGKVIRDYRANNAGTVGNDQLDAANPDAGRSYIPHQYTPRRPLNVFAFDKNIDPTVRVPAIFVANPL